MSIISAEAVKVGSLMANGCREITDLTITSDGRKFRRHFILYPGMDLEARVAERAAALTNSMVEVEQHEFMDLAEQGDITNIVPVWQTKQRVWRRAIREMMRNDGDLAMRFIPLMQRINANHTDTQIKNFLGITQNQLTALRERVTASLIPYRNSKLDDDSRVVRIDPNG